METMERKSKRERIQRPQWKWKSEKCKGMNTAEPSPTRKDKTISSVLVETKKCIDKCTVHTK